MDSSSHILSDEYTEIYRRLPRTLQLAYGVGHVLNDVCASMWFTYLLVFFHLVLQFSNWEAGFLLLVGQIADAISTPFVGYFSDRSDNFRCCRYGKRKSWHLFGTFCVIGAFPFIFSPCVSCTNAHKWAQMFYYCVFIVIFQFGWAAVQISHLSLIPELTPNEHDRTRLTAIRYSFTVISNLVVYIVTWVLLHMTNDDTAKIGPSDVGKFQGVVWTGLFLGMACSCIFHILVHEEGSNGGLNIRGSRVRASVKELLTDIQVYKVAVIYMSTRLFVNLTQVFTPLYLHETLDMTASALALIPLIMFLGSFFTSMFIEKLNKYLGRKISYILGGVCACIACLCIYFRTSETFANREIYFVAVLVGGGGSVMLVTSLGITADLIGDKTDSGALVYGIMSFTDKLANGVAVIIIQDLHNDSTNILYYRDILSYVCGGAAVLGILAVISLFTKRRTGQGLLSGSIPDYNSINDGQGSITESSTIQPSQSLVT